jgi:hypothetical protein
VVGDVSTAVNDALDGLDTEIAVAARSVAGHRGSAVADDDAVTLRAEDLIAPYQGSPYRGGGVHSNPSPPGIEDTVATYHIVNRPPAVEEGDRDAVSHHSIGDNVVAVALQDDPTLPVAVYPVLSR